MNKRFLWLLPVRSVIFILVFIIGSFVLGKTVSDISNWWSIVAVAVNFLMILMLLLTVKKCGIKFAELIDHEKRKTKVRQVVVMILVTLTVGMSGMYLAGFLCYGVIPYMAPMMVEPVPKTLAIINVLLLPVTTALAEDSLYLGIGVNNIENKWLSVIAPAFFFALQHCFIPTLFDVRFIIYRFLSFLPLTLIYSLYYRKHRNLLPIMIGHATIDLLTAVTILAASMMPGLFTY
ncbi:MAG: CPBP family intramembrane metalloprotease [Lachnospiraceae bacterium]|nr:CPBP family intramembrane metalloprotease [Lachnospiraceae bacterium]